MELTMKELYRRMFVSPKAFRGRPHDCYKTTVLYILPMVHFGNMSVGDVVLSSCSDRADSPPGSLSAQKQIGYDKVCQIELLFM